MFVLEFSKQRRLCGSFQNFKIEMTLFFIDDVRFNSFLFYSSMLPGLHSDSFLREINYPRQKGSRTASEQQGCGSRYFGWIRICLSDPDIFVGSGYFGRIRIFWLDQDMFVESGYFGRIRLFFVRSGQKGREPVRASGLRIRIRVIGKIWGQKESRKLVRAGLRIRIFWSDPDKRGVQLLTSIRVADQDPAIFVGSEDLGRFRIRVI